MGQIQTPQTTKGCTTTSIEGNIKDGTVSTPDQTYLVDKATYALRFPKLTIKPLAGGGITDVELKQLVMSGLIKVDEFLHNFFWYYKAEVSFDMTPPIGMPPIPYLSTSLFKGTKPDPKRRHTMAFFPSKATAGYLRRPDVIIVKDESVRWPGTKGLDHDGIAHEDNLERVIEVKFPGDQLSRGQRLAYERIAGDPNRFAVLEIKDCRGEEEREEDKQYNKEHKPTQAYDPSKWLIPPNTAHKPPRSAPIPVPVYGPTPLPRPAQVESWTQQVNAAVDSLLEQGAQSIREISQELQKHLEDAAAWISTKGQWARVESQKAWEWISETGGIVLRWTDDQLRATWAEVQRYTDLTLEALREVNWVQLLMDIGKVVATAIVIIVIGELIVAAAIPASLLAGLLAIIDIAMKSWVVLAAVLAKLATSPVPRQALNF